MKIAFFGDSITEGCFELFANSGGGIDVINDVNSCYATLVTNRLKNTFPNLKIESVNCGIGGESSGDGLRRIETSVINERPDIAVVCFGLNDVGQVDTEEYVKNMDGIFDRLKSEKIQTVFMTPNMINTYVHPSSLELLRETAERCAKCQNDGTMDLFMKKGSDIAEKNRVVICDAYAFWKKLQGYGIDTTELLCNYINHPTRAMHRVFADLLVPHLVKITESLN